MKYEKDIKKFDLESLAYSVIDFGDEVEYVIDRQAASRILNKEEWIVLSRLYDKKLFDFSLQEIVDAIERGGIVDKLSRH